MTSKLVRRLALPTLLIVALAACGGSATDEESPDDTATGPTETSGDSASGGASGEVRWFVGLGTGTDPSQVGVQDEVIAAYNAAQSDVVLSAEYVAFEGARDTLATQIASGNPPDLVGPVGILGAEAFRAQWLDLSPFIESSGLDLSQFSEAAVELFDVGGEGQIGLPIGLYPSMVFYDRDLFDEAGLNYPPQTVGEPYVWPDGTEAEWNFDTYRELAMRLTVDANGFDATQPEFDSDNIVQYGFDLPFPDVRYIANYFGAGTLIGDDGITVAVPANWVDAWKWYYDGMWVDHFIPTGPVRDSADFGGGYPFNVERAATTLSHLWYTCCIADADNWDIAVVPSHNGVTTSNVHADTFRILADSENPEAAFEALAHLVGDASLELLAVYGGLPTRTDDQDEFFALLDEQWPQGVNWEVASEMVAYPDNPNNESWLPATQESLDYLFTVVSRWSTTPDLDIDTEVETLQSELQAIWDSAG